MLNMKKKKEEKKSTIQKLREKMCEDDGTLCSMLKMFEGKLSASGTGFFVGEVFCYYYYYYYYFY
jgi:hypothetical protein